MAELEPVYAVCGVRGTHCGTRTCRPVYGRRLKASLCRARRLLSFLSCPLPSPRATQTYWVTLLPVSSGNATAN